MTFKRAAAITVMVACLAVGVMGMARDGSRTRSEASTLNITTSATAAMAPAGDPFLFSAERTAETVIYLEGIAAADAAKNAGESLVVSAPQNAGSIPVDSPAPVVSSLGGCANPIVPEAVAMRESGCDWGAVNPTGCGGRSCVGFFQLDLGHFSPVSPWNPAVPGVCYGLGDWHSPDVQIACASRLGPGAWG